MPSLKGSPPFSLSAHDWIKIGKGAALSIVGALAAYFTASVLPELRDHVANDVGVLIVTTIGALVPVLLNLATKYLTDTTTLVKVLLLATLLSGCNSAVSQPADASDVAVILDGSKAASYLVITDGQGGVTLSPLAKVVRVDPQPTPTPPNPPPPSPLTERAKAIKAAADKVTGDPDREGTAQGLALLYRKIAELAVTPGQVKDPATLVTALRSATDMFLSSRTANATPAWQGVRDVLGIQWTTIAAHSGSLGEYAVLLDEAASGLEASAPQKQITPQILDLILTILKLILPLLFPK